MSIKKSYIYVRNHSSYDEYEGCKLGKTNNIPERDIQYATGEIKRGSFIKAIRHYIMAKFSNVNSPSWK